MRTGDALLQRTRLEPVVGHHVGTTPTATTGLAVEKVAAEIAREALADETFRRLLRAPIQRRAAALLDELHATTAPITDPRPTDRSVP